MEKSPEKKGGRKERKKNVGFRSKNLRAWDKVTQSRNYETSQILLSIENLYSGTSWHHKFHAFRRTNRTSTWNRRIIFHFNIKEHIFEKLACVTGIFTFRRFEVYNDYTGCESNAWQRMVSTFLLWDDTSWKDGVLCQEFQNCYPTTRISQKLNPFHRNQTCTRNLGFWSSVYMHLENAYIEIQCSKKPREMMTARARCIHRLPCSPCVCNLPKHWVHLSNMDFYLPSCVPEKPQGWKTALWQVCSLNPKQKKLWRNEHMKEDKL